MHVPCIFPANQVAPPQLKLTVLVPPERHALLIPFAPTVRADLQNIYVARSFNRPKNFQSKKTKIPLDRSRNTQMECQERQQEPTNSSMSWSNHLEVIKMQPLGCIQVFFLYILCVIFVQNNSHTTPKSRLTLLQFKADEAEDSDEEWGNWSAGGTSAFFPDQSWFDDRRIRESHSP